MFDVKPKPPSVRACSPSLALGGTLIGVASKPLNPKTFVRTARVSRARIDGAPHTMALRAKGCGAWCIGKRRIGTRVVFFLFGEPVRY